MTVHAADIQDRTGQDRTGQDRTGQDRTGQDRTGQDRTGQVCVCVSTECLPQLRRDTVLPYVLLLTDKGADTSCGVVPHLPLPSTL